MKKKKIRFFINTLSCGGAEKVLVDLINNLEEYDITLVSVNGGVHEKRLRESVHYKKIVNFKNLTLNKFFSKVVYKIPLSFFRLLFLRGVYDLEIAYLGGFSTRVLAGKKAKHKIAFVHTDVSVSGKYDNLYKTEKEALDEYRKFDVVCFVSKIAKDGFEKKYGKLDNAIIVHNVVNVDEIKEKSKNNSNIEYVTEGLKIITVGRLSPEKGFDRLIKIARKLEKNYAFEIWILGEGEERQKLQTLIETHNVYSVKLLGFQENPYSFLKKADLYVCASYFEGYSTSVTEAIVLGLPVLTTDCAGMNEILVNGVDGIIVENDENALEEKLKEILENKNLYDAIKSGAEEKGRAYSNNCAFDEYLQLFNLLI